MIDSASANAWLDPGTAPLSALWPAALEAPDTAKGRHRRVHSNCSDGLPSHYMFPAAQTVRIRSPPRSHRENYGKHRPHVTWTALRAAARVQTSPSPDRTILNPLRSSRRLFETTRIPLPPPIERARRLEPAALKQLIVWDAPVELRRDTGHDAGRGALDLKRPSGQIGLSGEPGAIRRRARAARAALGPNATRFYGP